MIQIKTLFLFQGNPQNNDQILTLEIVLHYRQQFLCPSNYKLKGPETKKTNNKQRNRLNSYHVLLNYKRQDMRDQKTKAQIKKT